MGWFTEVLPGTRRFTVRVEGVVWSPEGSYFAFWKAREADVDLRERERVYVVEAATGRTVLALDGPLIVRALGWATSEVLCVLREHPRGRDGVLSLHAVPDGGELESRGLRGLGGVSARLRASRDGARLMVIPAWEVGRALTAPAYVVKVPGLAQPWSFEPELLPNAVPVARNCYLRADLGVEGDLAVFSYEGGWPPVTSRVVVVDVETCKVRLARDVERSFRPRFYWPGRGRLLTVTGESGRGRVLLHDLRSGEVRFDTRRLTSWRWRIRECFDLHPEHTHGLLLGRPVRTEDADPDAPLDAPSALVTVDLTTGEVTELGGYHPVGLTSGVFLPDGDVAAFRHDTRTLERWTPGAREPSFVVNLAGVALTPGVRLASVPGGRLLALREVSPGYPYRYLVDAAQLSSRGASSGMVRAGV